jgi:hypothetical protein
MIRLRTAFLIILIGCAGAFFIGFQTGYLIARSDYVANGLKKWVDNAILTGNLTIGSDKR